MAKLIFDLSGRGGLAPKFNGDNDRTISTPALRYLGDLNQMAEGIFNPFRRYGYISPSNATFADLTFTSGTFDAQISSTAHDFTNDDHYFASRGQQIWKIDGLDDTELAEQLDLGATGTPIITDLEMYQLNGSPKLFYVYEKSGNMEIGESSVPTFSANNNWLTADATGAFTNTVTGDPFMRVSDNGFAYIFQDNNVHKLDGSSAGGATGTVTANVLQFPITFQITDALDYRGKLYILLRQDTVTSWTTSESVFTSKVGVYVWDRSSTVVNSIDFIPINGAKHARNIYVSPSGELRLMVANSDNIGEIRQYNGNTFVPIVETGLKAYPQYRDALTTVSSSTVWLGGDGGIYSHGIIIPGEPERVYQIGKVPDTVAVGGFGCIMFGGSNTDSAVNNEKATKNGLYIFYRTAGAVNKAKEWDIYGTGADGVVALAEQGDIYSLVKFLPQMSTVNYIDVYMAVLNTSGSATAGTIKIYFNQSTSAWASKIITRDDISKGYIRLEVDKPYINTIQLEIEFNSTITIGENDFAPSIAIVDYTPTTTKG